MVLTVFLVALANQLVSIAVTLNPLDMHASFVWHLVSWLYQVPVMTSLQPPYNSNWRKNKDSSRRRSRKYSFYCTWQNIIAMLPTGRSSFWKRKSLQVKRAGKKWYNAIIATFRISYLLQPANQSPLSHCCCEHVCVFLRSAAHILIVGDTADWL